MSRFDQTPNKPDAGFQLNDWSRGITNLRPAEKLPPGYYARLINGEIRRGIPESRRGVRTMGWMMDTDGTPLADTVQCVQWFRPSRPGRVQPPDCVLLIGDDKLWRCRPNNKPLLVAEDVTDSTQPCTIIPAHNVALILRGLGQVPVIYDPYGQRKLQAGIQSLPEPRDALRTLPAADTGCYASGRIWLKVGYDEIIASDIFEFDYAVANTFKIESGGNGEIVKMLPYGDDGIAIFKTDGVFMVISISDLDYLKVERVYAAKGCIAADSVALIGSDILYLSHDGVERLSVNGDRLVAQTNEQFSAPMAQYFRGMVWPASSAARALVIDNYYVLSVPSKATWRQVDALARDWGTESDYEQDQDLPGDPWTPTTWFQSVWQIFSLDWILSASESFASTGWFSTSLDWLESGDESYSATGWETYSLDA